MIIPVITCDWFSETFQGLGLSCCCGELGRVPCHLLDPQTKLWHHFGRLLEFFMMFYDDHPFFNQNSGEKKKNHLLILLGYCFTVCPQPQNSRTSDSCDSRPQRGLGLTVTFSPGDKQEALAQSWVHIISRADLDGFDRGEGEWGGWGPYTRREDHSPKTGSQETSYLELDQTIPGQSVLLFHLQSPTTSSLPGKQWPRWLKMLESELTAPQIPCNFHILWSHCACMVLLWACFVAVVVLSWQMLKMLRQRTATMPCSTDIIHTC